MEHFPANLATNSQRQEQTSCRTDGATSAGCYSLHPPLEQFKWHFSICFMVALMIDITLLILTPLLLLKGNYVTKAELQE